MREIRKLEKNQLRAALSIASKAYPVMGITSTQKLDELETRLLEDFEHDTREWYGLFEDGRLLGNMVLYDFVTNYYGKDIKAKGIGFVAVDFLHKKQKICKDMLHWYLKDSLQKRYPLAILYAFRPDFYKKMGFGFGTACYNYVTSPDRLPGADKYTMQYLKPSDKAEVEAFYLELYQRNHGMIPKKAKDIDTLLKGQDINVVGYKESNRLTALIVYRLISNENSSISTDMKVELMFISPCGLKAALSFLNSQADQVREISISTLYRDFFYNLADIRHVDHRILREPGFHHTYDTGMGMMYRSLNPVELIMNRPCRLEKMKIRFTLNDSFLDNSIKEFVIAWKDGTAALSKSTNYDICIKFDVSDFSSWVWNATDLATLYQYGLVEISAPTYIPVLDQAFYYQQRPMCQERF